MPLADAMTTGLANVPPAVDASGAAALGPGSARIGLPKATPAAAVAPTAKKSRRVTDMDAPNISMNRLGEQPDNVALAAVAIGVGTVSNTVLKLGLALTLGSPAFRRLAGAALLLIGAATAAGILVVR